MPTVLRTFPEISRVGHQETLWSAPIPSTIEFLLLESLAQDVVLLNPLFSADIVVYVSPDGTDATQQEIQRYHWYGGDHATKPDPPGTRLPNDFNIEFGPLTKYVGWRVKLSADIPVAMVIGARVTSLP